MFERFTQEARAAVIDAQEQCRRLGDPEITAVHLLHALTQGPAGEVLARHHISAERLEPRRPDDDDAIRTLGIDPDAVRERMEKSFGPGALDRPVRRRRWPFGRRPCGSGHRPFTAGAKRALEASLREAARLSSNRIDADVLVLGLLRAQDRSVDGLLRALHVDVAALRRDLESRIRRVA